MDSLILAKGNAVFDEEILERLSYERSLIWANLFERIEKDAAKDIHDIKVSDLEFTASDEDDQNTAEEAVESDCEVESILPDTPSRSQTEVSMCEEVLTILKEHRRKWRQAGLENILNNFNKKLIEKKVGGWLRQHEKKRKQQKKK